MMPAVLRFLGLCLLLCSAALAEPGVDAAAQRIRIALKSEPATLNSVHVTEAYAMFVLNHVMEGLLQYDARNELTAGVAERWELRPDGATFWLRRDARWSDGMPVTAHDFVFAWRHAIEPKTASRYASVLFPLKNAERINRGELAVTALGVIAADDYRLDVQFERPCPYFLGLTAFATYLPLREDFVHARGERYAADAGDLLFNGPFVLTRWDHNSRLTLQKNPHYWNATTIRLKEIDIPYITADTSATFNLMQERSIAMVLLDASTVQEAAARGMSMQLFPTGGLFFFEFNLRSERLTRNIHLRRAIQAIFAPEQLTDKVVGLPGNQPALSFFPNTVKGIEGYFRDEFPPPMAPRGLDISRRELALAKQELNIREWPPLVLLVRSTPTEKKLGEYLQQLLQRGLGIPTRIDTQILKLAIEKTNRGDFDISMSAWLPDFDDAITFGDLMASWNENNRGQYRSERYDALVSAANATADNRVRMPLFAQMQQLLIEDVPVLPIFVSTEAYAIDPQLRGVTRAIFGGDLDFRYAYLEAAH